MPKLTSQTIEKVFSPYPRYGYEKNTHWIKRKEEEETLDKILNQSGQSACVDGPTGSGKTSLVLTTLKRKKIDFVYVQLTKNMTWDDFCRKLLNTHVNNCTSFDFYFETGIDKGLPVFKAHFGFKSSKNKLDDLEYEDKLIARMTDHKICEILQENNVALVVDDFERSDKIILNNIAEMCKLILNTYQAPNLHLLIVGIDDIYGKLIEANKSLPNRVTELSLGTICNSDSSWIYLIEGFSKLNLNHIVNEYNNNIGDTTMNDLKECKEYCYNAADGLVKALNNLGHQISSNASSVGRISKATIIKVSKQMFEDNVNSYNRRYPQILETIALNPFIKMLINKLYTRGIGRIHKWSEITSEFDYSTDSKQIDLAIKELIKINFLTSTGKQGDVLYVTDPILAHTFGVAISNKKLYDLPRILESENLQLNLAFD
jgi:hypothetical protein